MRARQRILNALDQSADHNPDLYSEAVSLFIVGRMFDDAEAVHLRYTTATGKQLAADFELDEIREMRTNTSPAHTDGAVVFKRLTLWERGHFSNYFSLRPVTRIVIADAGITIWRWRKAWTFAWSRVGVEVRRRAANKAIGRYAHSRYTQKLCTIRAGGMAFTLDVSDQYPDVGSPRELISHLARRVSVTDVTE